jgi:hypothetical protein
MLFLERARRILPGLWAGWLLCVGLLATPAPFALLVRADAGRVVARMLAQEAYTSLALGVALLVLERLVARRAVLAGRGSQFSAGMALALGTLLCTVAGYFAIQPLLPAARAGQGAFGFGQLHAVSTAFFVVKTGLVLALAWRALTPPAGAGGATRRPFS